MQKKRSREFSYTPIHKLPKLGKIKTEWDLKAHYYKSEDDPRIEADIVTVERAYDAFAKRYRNKKFTANAKSLLAALKDYEELGALPEASKAGRYLSFRITRNAHDTKALKKISLIDNRLTKAVNKVIFFELEVGKIPANLQKQYLADPKLAHFHYHLKTVFLDASHLLSEAEEKILNLKSDVAHGLWVSGTDNMLSRRTIKYKGETIPLASAMDRIDTVASSEKPKLWALITDGLEALAEVAENEVHAVVTNKKINDELRHYEKPYSATIMGYENDERSVLALVEAISTKGFALSQRYYAHKAKLAGVKKILYVNRNDVIGPDINISYETAVTVCRDTFYGMDQKYGRIFDTMLTNGSIDVYPKEGKGGGAFCAGSVNLPTYVMLNNVGNLRSFTTLAHEMGHAIHTERSKTQSPIYQGYSTTTAETASTLFEGLSQRTLMERLTEDEKAGMLDRKIGEAIATICRQIAFFNFEKELHDTIRAEGGMTWKEIAKLLQHHIQSYVGKSVEVTEKDGLSFVFIGHFRNFFYVYTYAYGELMSNVMAERYLANKDYIREIDTFLTSGGNDTVENIFKRVGIDTMKIQTFENSLKALEEDIKAFEKITKA